MKLFFLIYLLLCFQVFSISKDDFKSLIINCSDKIQKNFTPFEYVPSELVLAQAILESNWGNSRFAKEGNNYFGMRTWDPSKKQIKPLKRPNADFGLIVYSSACESVKDYISNLNNSDQYESFRKIRELEIKLWGKADPKVLAKGLGNYSEEKGEYINKVIDKIRILQN